MNASFHSAAAVVAAAIVAAGRSSAIVGSRPLPEPPILRAAAPRRFPFGFVRFAPPTEDGMKPPARRGLLNLPVVPSRKGRLLAQLATR